MHIVPITPIVIKPTFSDVNLSIDELSPTELVVDEEAIQKSIFMILGTPVGSRVFRRDFGAKLDALLFEPMDDITVQRIKSGIISAISRWETRLFLTDVTVSPDYDNLQYFVSMSYTIPSLGGRSASFVFNLSQGT